jgi:polyhydroxybutyrate depolymerase
MFAPLALALMLLAAGAASAEQLTSGGLRRDYEIFLPNGTAGPRPAVFLLHGGGGTAAEMRGYTGFDDLAEVAGIVAVYPQGIERDWNDPRRADGSVMARDDQFLLDLADRLVAMGIVDRRRIYIAGISNGGIMALQMACFHADRIAGAAAVAASLPIGMDCRPARGLPVILINGTEDRLVPLAGDPLRLLPLQQSVALLAQREGCRLRHSRALAAPVPADGTRARVDDYDGCTAGGALESVIVEGGEHSWPGARASLVPANIQSPASRAIDANRQIWRFFASQPPMP